MSKKPAYSISVLASAIMLFGVSSASAEEDRYDKTIEATQIARAAEKVHGLRDTIAHDQAPEMITRQDVQDSLKRRTSGITRKIWVAPEPENALPPIVYRIRTKAVDKTMTAGIGERGLPPGQKLVWEKFNAKGKLIK